MSFLIESVRSMFSNLWSKEEEKEEVVGISTEEVSKNKVETPKEQENSHINKVEGFIVSTNTQYNQSLVLIQSNEHTWQTKWFNNAETIYTTPSRSLQTIFK